MTMGGEEGLGVTTGQPNLYKQDLSKLDVNKLTALSREVISRQATINIGTIGHVAHGKSTIVKAISGVQTVRFKNELERNITIKLDTRVAQTNSKERADSLGSSNEMPSTSEKRPISPGSIQPRTKQRKLNENVTLCKKEEVFDSLSISSNKDTSVNLNDTAECQKHNSKESCMDVTKSHNNTRSTTQQKLKYNSNNLQLKELRIVLKDINRDGKVDECALQQDFCEVEQILKKKKCDGIVYYLIKWKNWSLEYNTWEPATNLINCSDLLVDFENSIKKEMLKLLENFKRRVNFYPRQSDVTEFFNKMRKNGTTIDRMLIEEEEVYRSVKIFYKQKFIKNGRFERSVKKNILYLMLSDLRKSQLNSLKEWENEMNSITKCKPLIRVENLVDLESAPRKFFYIKNYLPGNGVIIPEDPPIGCECINCHASKADCCSSQCDAIFPYTTTGKIRVPPGTPVYECNKRCSCNMNCLNRVVQRGTEMHFCVFRTANGRGWGVKTLKSIKKGSFVTQYVGEVITNEEAEKRGQQYDAAGRTYLFDLDYNETEGQCPYTVDAGIYGNISHFINHSCDPNLVVYAVWINCLDPNLPNIALFATRDIKQNEEITFDYMCQAFKNNEKMIGQKTQNKNKFNLNASSKLYETLDIHSRASESDIVTSRTLCKCGAKTCRKYLF